ncbi:uncharacterized protein BCR38DRAFT_505397 [Pseudomassariella vexata]|uniref:Uncharacterized protein n=1 Tax=Pseudomassariella vexata TaxID=1141098 RepID=A0A1Y2DBC8_9PEZI|nr:uncharacterized protein BCR38DRAFT_505397 [Pseudomassariella vexata]ORY56426.1 hypothetical protein BCR38DRAFT_505397 [Pseudomassariella vexata]
MSSSFNLHRGPRGGRASSRSTDRARHGWSDTKGPDSYGYDAYHPNTRLRNYDVRPQGACLPYRERPENNPHPSYTPHSQHTEYTQRHQYSPRPAGQQYSTRDHSANQWFAYGHRAQSPQRQQMEQIPADVSNARQRANNYVDRDVFVTDQVNIHEASPLQNLDQGTNQEKSHEQTAAAYTGAADAAFKAAFPLASSTGAADAMLDSVAAHVLSEPTAAGAGNNQPSAAADLQSGGPYIDSDIAMSDHRAAYPQKISGIDSLHAAMNGKAIIPTKVQDSNVKKRQRLSRSPSTSPTKRNMTKEARITAAYDHTNASESSQPKKKQRISAVPKILSGPLAQKEKKAPAKPKARTDVKTRRMLSTSHEPEHAPPKIELKTSTNCRIMDRAKFIPQPSRLCSNEYSYEPDHTSGDRKEKEPRGRATTKSRDMNNAEFISSRSQSPLHQSSTESKHIDVKQKRKSPKGRSTASEHISMGSAASVPSPSPERERERASSSESKCANGKGKGKNLKGRTTNKNKSLNVAESFPSRASSLSPEPEHTDGKRKGKKTDKILHTNSLSDSSVNSPSPLPERQHKHLQGINPKPKKAKANAATRRRSTQDDDDEDEHHKPSMSHFQGRSAIRIDNRYKSPFHISPMDTFKVNLKRQIELMKICTSLEKKYYEVDDDEMLPSEEFWTEVMDKYNIENDQKGFSDWRFLRDWVNEKCEHRYKMIKERDLPPPTGKKEPLAVYTDKWCRVMIKHKYHRAKECVRAGLFAIVQNQLRASLRTFAANAAVGSCRDRESMIDKFVADLEKAVQISIGNSTSNDTGTGNSTGSYASRLN